MKQNEFKNTLAVFKNLQTQSDSPIVAEAIIRKFGGGRGREIKTLHILLSISVRPGQRIPAYAWMNTVCNKWNEALYQIAIGANKSLNSVTRFVLDGNTVSTTVSGSILKVSANMVEKGK